MIQPEGQVDGTPPDLTREPMDLPAGRPLRLQALTRGAEGVVLMRADTIQATGFLEHIKLPHYVDFQSELELVRKLRAGAPATRSKAAE